MRTRLMTLTAGLALVASAAAGAANSPAPAAAAPAPAFSGGGHAFSGGVRGGAVGGHWMSGGHGSYGMAGRGTYGGMRAGATRHMGLMAPGRAAGYDFIVANHAPAGVHGPRGLEGRLSWAPATASAAHAVRIVEGLQRRPIRTNNRLIRRTKETPLTPDQLLSPFCAIEGGQVTCPVNATQEYLQRYNLNQGFLPRYCFEGDSLCRPTLMPEALCVEPGPDYQYRRDECARAIKTRLQK